MEGMLCLVSCYCEDIADSPMQTKVEYQSIARLERGEVTKDKLEQYERSPERNESV